MSIFKKINEGVNSLAIKTMTVTEEAKPQSKKALRAKKILTVITTCAVAATMCSITAFATSRDIPTFFTDAIKVLKVVVILIGGGVGVWGVINLLEGYSNDNPGAKSQGMKQLMAGVGIALIGIFLVPKLGTLMSEQSGNIK